MGHLPASLQACARATSFGEPLQQDYEGDKSNLGSLEQFFLVISDVPRYEQVCTACFVGLLRARPTCGDYTWRVIVAFRWLACSAW